MSQKHGAKSLAILHHLMKHSDKNRLEIELELGFGDLGPAISQLRGSGHIASIPKKRSELVRYRITDMGRGVIGGHIQKQESLRHRPLHELPVYVPQNAPVRQGSMRAYQLPSRGMV